MSSLQGKTALERRLRAIGDTSAFLHVLQLAAVAEAKHLVPRKTGALGRSIVPGAVSADSAKVEARQNYAGYVEHGTKPHVIRPKNRKALAWGGERRLSGRLRAGASATHFAKKVNHPGTKPKPYLIPGAKKAVATHGVEVIVKEWNDAA